MGVFALRKRLIIVFSKKVRSPVPKPKAWVGKQIRRGADVSLYPDKKKRQFSYEDCRFFLYFYRNLSSLVDRLKSEKMIWNTVSDSRM